jgi:hypothetical protein
LCGAGASFGVRGGPHCDYCREAGL